MIKKQTVFYPDKYKFHLSQHISKGSYMIKNELNLPSSIGLSKIIPVVILLILFISLFGSWYTVDQGERGVIQIGRAHV